MRLMDYCPNINKGTMNTKNSRTNKPHIFAVYWKD